MESRPARLFDCAWRAQGRERSTDVHGEGKEEGFIRTKRHSFRHGTDDVSVLDVWRISHTDMSFGISARILAYQSTFGVSARILAYQSMFLYHFPLLTGSELQYRGWELQYRIRGCFHPVHVHSPVFLEPNLSSLHSIHDKAVPSTGVCLPARATGVATTKPSRQPVSVFPHALLAS